MLDLLGGSLTGIIGGAVTSVTNYFNNKQNNEHEIAKIKTESEAKIAQTKAQTDAAIAEADANIRISETEVAGEVQLAEMDAYKQSMKDQMKRSFKSGYMDKLMENKWTAWIGGIISFLFGIADFSKETARVIITYYLLGVITWVTYLAYTVLSTQTKGAISPETASTLFMTIINTVRYLLISCISWWFVDRQASKALKQMNIRGNSAK
ncbi:MAG: hypothetical protein ACQESF_02550 [Nanobdellota archaeon]